MSTVLAYVLDLPTVLLTATVNIISLVRIEADLREEPTITTTTAFP
jgi:hypothetical protein